MAGIVFSGYLSYKLNIFPNEIWKEKKKHQATFLENTYQFPMNWYLRM